MSVTPERVEEALAWADKYFTHPNVDVLAAALREAQAEADDWKAACEESQASEADLMADIERMRERIRHVVNDSPGTPESVKQYLRAALAPADEATP